MNFPAASGFPRAWIALAALTVCAAQARAQTHRATAPERLPPIAGPSLASATAPNSGPYMVPNSAPNPGPYMAPASAPTSEPSLAPSSGPGPYFVPNAVPNAGPNPGPSFVNDPVTGPTLSTWSKPTPVTTAPVLPSTTAVPQSLTDPVIDPSDVLMEGDFPPPGQPWEWQLLPVGIIYRSYLAGYKESRFASVWNYQRDWGGLWDIALGGRAGILRYGTNDPIWPEGFQLDIEGAAFPRLDLAEERDLVACDYRFGVPLTYREGRWEYKFGYYHLSSHLGDEYMIKNPSVPRINYVRENLILGIAWFQTPWLRWYTELGWAFSCDVAEPWEFQFGADYAPPGPTGFRGAPFWALNTYLREEVDFSGNFVAQVGWAWRGAPSGHLFRVGFEYYNGMSSQFEFYNQFEEKVGLGMWFDF